MLLRAVRCNYVFRKFYMGLTNIKATLALLSVIIGFAVTPNDSATVRQCSWFISKVASNKTLKSPNHS